MPQKNDDAEKQVVQWRIVTVVSVLMALFSAAVLAVSLTSKSSATLYMAVIEGYDGGALLTVLGVVGFVSLMVGILGTILAFLAMTPKYRKKLRYLLYAYMGWTAGLVVLLLASSILTFMCTGSLEVVFKTGFFAKMAKYSKELTIRKPIDKIQKEIQCCGNTNYTEWFTVAWSDSLAKTEMGIPESCCDAESAKGMKTSCTTTVAFQNSMQLTPYKKGCVNRLARFYKLMLYKDVGLMLAALLFAIISLFLTYTALQSRDVVLEEKTLIQKKPSSSTVKPKESKSKVGLRASTVKTGSKLRVKQSATSAHKGTSKTEVSPMESKLKATSSADVSPPDAGARPAPPPQPFGMPGAAPPNPFYQQPQFPGYGGMRPGGGGYGGMYYGTGY